MIYAILLSLVTSLLFLGLGILIGSICNEKSVGGVSSLIISMHSVLSGMWFPTDQVNGGMIKFMNVLPFKNATLLVQNSINGINNTFTDFICPLLIVILYTLVVFIVSIILFKNKMKSK